MGAHLHKMEHVPKTIERPRPIPKCTHDGSEGVYVNSQKRYACPVAIRDSQGDYEKKRKERETKGQCCSFHRPPEISMFAGTRKLHRVIRVCSHCHLEATWRNEREGWVCPNVKVATITV